MNKLFACAAMAALSLTAYADENASDLIFLFQDGSQQTIGSQNLEMTISDGAIQADNGSMSLLIPLSDLQKFYFSATTGISCLTQPVSNWTLYDLEGKPAGKFDDLKSCQGQLAPGVYVAKCATSTIKIAIK